MTGETRGMEASKTITCMALATTASETSCTTVREIIRSTAREIIFTIGKTMVRIATSVRRLNRT